MNPQSLDIELMVLGVGGLNGFEDDGSGRYVSAGPDGIAHAVDGSARPGDVARVRSTDDGTGRQVQCPRILISHGPVGRATISSAGTDVHIFEVDQAGRLVPVSSAARRMAAGHPWEPEQF